MAERFIIKVGILYDMFISCRMSGKAQKTDAHAFGLTLTPAAASVLHGESCQLDISLNKLSSSFRCEPITIAKQSTFRSSRDWS